MRKHREIEEVKDIKRNKYTKKINVKRKQTVSVKRTFQR